MARKLTAAEAAALIRDGMTVAVDGFIGFSLAEDILCELESRFLREGHPRDLRLVNVAGLGNDQWVAMDFVDVLVHIFLPEVRAYYDLEHLWADAKLTHIPNLD